MNDKNSSQNQGIRNKKFLFIVLAIILVLSIVFLRYTFFNSDADSPEIKPESEDLGNSFSEKEISVSDESRFFDEVRDAVSEHLDE